MTIDNKAKTDGNGLIEILCTMAHCFDKGKKPDCYDKDYKGCSLYKFLDNPLYKQGGEQNGKKTSI